MAKDIVIYCVCFPKHEPRKTQIYQKNIMCNAATISNKYRASLENKDFVFDDTGVNISALNGVFGDLTATYWVWKNSHYDIVGTSQYRRFWDDSIGDLDFKENTIYVQDPRVLDDTIRNQYIGSHGELGLEILDELALNNKIKLTPDMLQKTYSLRYLYSCNMFIAHKPLYDKFCEILFEIVFEIYNSYEDVIKKLDPYNRRLPAFVSERVLTALIVNKEHFFPDVEFSRLKWAVKKPPLLMRALFNKK